MCPRRLLHLRPRLRPCHPPDRDHQRAARRRRPTISDRASAPRAPNGCSRAPACGAVDAAAGETDTGVVQIDSLRPDVPETIRRARAFHDELRRARRRAKRRSSDRTARRSSSPTRRRWRARPRRPPASRRSSARTSPGTGSTATTASSPASPLLVAQIGEVYAHGRRRLAAADRTAASKRSDTIVDVPFVARHARADWTPAINPAAELGLPADGRWRWSRSAATACASCRSTVSTAWRTGMSCCRHRAASRRTLAAPACINVAEDAIYGAGCATRISSAPSTS